MNTEETTAIKEKQLQFATYALNEIKNWCEASEDVWDDPGDCARDALSAIQHLGNHIGLGIVAGNPGGIEADSPAGTATPNPELINVEALEKEGWENTTRVFNAFFPPTPDSTKAFQKGKITIVFEAGIIEIFIGGAIVAAVSSMQDLRTLEALINGPQK